MDNFNDTGRRGLAAWTFLSLFFFFFAAIAVKNNWDWYVDLTDEGIRPSYASEYVNIIIWVLFFISYGWLVSFTARHHPNASFINSLFVVILLLNFTWIVYMFEKRSFTFPKWVASLSLLIMLYIAYDAYVRGLFMVIFAMLIHLLILTWSVVQLWYSDAKVNSLQDDCKKSCKSSESEYSHPWSSCPGYSKWYRKPKSHGKSSCSSRTWW